ncbi:hypothetical protein SPRA44_600088 [Serratia proteamaculans]|uniref:hypothetical protein n=1 Tax=Serratia proteamaculans TaxID=28151 RepID=UPI0009F7E7FB|nr:hypothetical protein [Serratia proteamaculans]SMB45849.1 hypothetical protein SPRA44_600088 [Serratia proteamaculans]
MQQRIAIVGGGIAAGLAARLLAPLGTITLIQPVNFVASSMPEIVPRQAFFEALALPQEAEWVAAIAPSATQVIWRNGTETYEADLASTDDFLIYDKGRLAARLLDSAPVFQRIQSDVAEIAEVEGFDRVFDCRGAKAVKADPSYQYKKVSPARTACRYVVASTQLAANDRVMHFWSETTVSGKKRTFFQIPLGGNRVSLGCSCIPDDLISSANLYATAAKEGWALSIDSVMFSGVVVPQPCEMTCVLTHVTPLGDADALSCPLGEYGTLKTLSQIITIVGGKPLAAASLQRPLNGEVDPHMPQELFS